MTYKTKTPIFLDFETFMDIAGQYSLKKMSDIQYILDPRFEVLSISVHQNGRTLVYPGDSAVWLKELQKLNTRQNIFVAHNGRFDFRILKLRYNFQPINMGDTMLMARYRGFSKCDLATQANRIGLDKLDLQTDGKHLDQLTREEWFALVRYNANDVVITKTLYSECLERIPEQEIRLIDQTLRLCLKKHYLDWDLFDKIGFDSMSKFEALMLTHPDLVKNRSRSAYIRNKIKNESGIDPGSVDKKRVDIHSLPEEARKVLEIIWEAKELIKISTDTQSLRQRIIDPRDNMALIDLNYSKAVTHRWSSGGEEARKSFNIQNMRRDSGIRELWVPDPNCVYIIVDLSQIEARIAAWFGGEVELLSAFEANRDVYCEFGQHIFGRVLDKKIDKNERQICKEAILGLGFGMGAKTFHERLQLNAKLALESARVALGGNTTKEAAEAIVIAYRKAYKKLSSLPKESYRAVEALCSSNNSVSSRTIGYGPARFTFEYRPAEKALKATLPTSGYIVYRGIESKTVPSKFRPGQTEREISYTFMDRRNKISFSSPFENIVQGTARDLLCQQILKAEECGFDLRMHAHDEAVFNVPKDTALEALQEIKSIFSASIANCPGLPIACDAHISDKYTKDDEYKQTFEKTLRTE